MKAALTAAIVAAIVAAGTAGAAISQTPAGIGTVQLCVNRVDAGGNGLVTQPVIVNGVSTCSDGLQPIAFEVRG